ncbi:hypothetical protein [Lactiplantibacillus paraplantarum]|uniref:Uncharacterized protein n=1 Tax=Lactiplantibacillus paraplantarum TaxID=60520 RepID=A0AAD0X6B8_9LACO|nr:hypothetical protein [Lactiplantibacillus paraplantarum]AYJ38183.1 hypothetical protein LP667_04780 [Lactiplantibacillus paraplantarum]KRL49575.1 hypothetical protein FD48_GL000670 [Lactiplantibacillus paraplantarum DSM 10667]GBF03544.1 hypothetical protein LPPLD21_03114 [Lactiplantibacillus paraplantarum]GEO60976.1 hypothetical protein LPA07_12970 [Lactiplantibacillus paraplantarum]
MYMNIIATIFTVLLGVLILFLRQLPAHISNKLIANTKFLNNRQLQVEQYFRQLGGSELKEVMEEWTKYITFIDETMETLNSDDGIARFKSLTHKTLLYGSDKTVAILGLLNQYNFKGQRDGGAKLMLYIANLIASLKYDFTGYQIDPLDLLRTEITDFDSNERDYNKMNADINEELHKLFSHR